MEMDGGWLCHAVEQTDSSLNACLPAFISLADRAPPNTHTHTHTLLEESTGSILDTDSILRLDSSYTGLNMLFPWQY